MNIVKAIQRREEGLESIRDYDIALYRLKCYHDDVYHGIRSNINARDFNPQPPVFACRFCTTPGYEEILALANEDGHIALQDTKIKKGSNESLEGIQAHCNAIFDVTWMPGELKLVTVSGDHTACLWDVSRPDITQINCYHAHTRSVKTAVFRHQDKAVFATGARDGMIMIWDIRANHSDKPKPDNCIINAHKTISGNTKRKMAIISRAQSITGLAFQDDLTLISCAAGDGLIKVWDLRKNYTIYKKEPIAKYLMNYAGNSTRCGFSSLLICPARIMLYASCMDNVIYAYNASSYNSEPVAEYYGHQNRTYYVKTCLSSDGRYLASGSSDDFAYIWRINRPGVPLVRLSGHTEEVTCTAWCSIGETKIVTCCDDSCHRIWRVGFEHKIENEEVKIRGRAETMSERDISVKLETTPTTTTTFQNIYRESTSDDNIAVTPGTSSGKPLVSSHYDFGEHHTSLNLSGMKRNHRQMMVSSKYESNFKSILSPVHENYELITKRLHMDNRGARKLFSPSHKTCPSSSEDYDSDEPSTSQSISANSKNAEITFSPTSNLPNFVVDGTAPHLLQMSPQKHKENVDWLTKIKKERYQQKSRKSISERPHSPKTQVTPARRSGRSRSHEPQKATKTTKNSAISLLNFFKTLDKNSEKDPSSTSTDIVPLTNTS